MKMIILIGLFLSVITVEPKSIQRKKAAGNAEQRARQLDQGSATVEDRDENGEEQVLQKMLRIRQAVQLQAADSGYGCKITDECNLKYQNLGGLLGARKHMQEKKEKEFPNAQHYCESNACECIVSCTSWEADVCTITDECNLKYKNLGGLLGARKYMQEKKEESFPNAQHYCESNACECIVSCTSWEADVCTITDECNLKQDFKNLGGLLGARKHMQEELEKRNPNAQHYCESNACECYVRCLSWNP